MDGMDGVLSQEEISALLNDDAGMDAAAAGAGGLEDLTRGMIPVWMQSTGQMVWMN